MVKKQSCVTEGVDNGMECDSTLEVPEYFDMPSAAKLCGITRQAVGYRKRNNKLPYRIINGITMIHRDDVYKMRAEFMHSKLLKSVKSKVKL